MTPIQFQRILDHMSSRHKGDYEVTLQVGSEFYRGPLVTMDVTGNPPETTMINSVAGRGDERKNVYVSVEAINAMWVDGNS